MLHSRGCNHNYHPLFYKRKFFKKSPNKENPERPSFILKVVLIHHDRIAVQLDTTTTKISPHSTKWNEGLMFFEYREMTIKSQ